MTTRARASAGNERGSVHARASAEAAPFRAEALRARRADARRLSPLPPGPVVTRRYAAPGTAPADQRGLARPPCRASSRRARSPSRALPPVASLRDGASATLEQ
jgi:hypothetical protein